MTPGGPHPPRNGEGDRAKRGGGGRAQLQRPIVYTARKLRKEMSPPEALLWQQLRQRPGGLKFRRQHPVDPYVVDFLCSKARLIVEIDGWAHETASTAENDEKRDQALEARGFTILRIPAEDVMGDVGGAVMAILARAGSPLHHAPHGPPPRTGEDR
jgi:very-short-patch-repair endonuclease